MGILGCTLISIDKSVIAPRGVRLTSGSLHMVGTFSEFSDHTCVHVLVDFLGIVVKCRKYSAQVSRLIYCRPGCGYRLNKGVAWAGPCWVRGRVIKLRWGPSNK